MDIYNLITKIPYILMLLTGVTIILQMYVGGLHTISMNIDQYDQEKFRSAVVLENTLSVKEDPSELNYSYDHRRAVIPVEFFTQKLSNSGNDVGYKVRNGDCYIPKVAGLDGRDFGFYIRSLDEDMSADLDCTTRPSGVTETVLSPVLLIRKANADDNDAPLPARLYIYAKQ